MKFFRKILFVRTDRIGDVLMNLPAIHLLRQTYPGAAVDLVIDGCLEDLLDGHPDISRTITIDAGKLKTDGLYFLKTAFKLRQAKYDLAVVSNPDKFLHALVFMSGIAVRAGYRRKWPFLLTKTIQDDKSTNTRHEIDANLRLVSLVSEKSWDGQIVFPSRPDALEKVRRLVAQKGLKKKIAVIHAGTTNPAKRWAADEFVVLCDLILARGDFDICLIGGKREKEFSEQIAGRTRLPIANWTGAIGLSELKAFFDFPQVQALVSCDSGPAHMAWMSGKPVIALFAKNVEGSNPFRWGPRNGSSRVIYKPMSEIKAMEVYQLFETVTGLLNA